MGEREGGREGGTAAVLQCSPARGNEAVPRGGYGCIKVCVCVWWWWGCL